MTAMAYDKLKLAELVKSGRAAKGYTQAELAEATNISLRSIQRMENAEVEPRLYTIKVLAGQLDFDYEQAALQAAPVTTAPPPSIKKISRPRQLILSVGTALLLLLISGAFLSQASRFPETNFESFSFWTAVLAVYLLLLWRIWK